MRPPFLEAHLKREPVTVPKYQLLWQFYVKDGQPLRAAEILAALAESESVLFLFTLFHQRLTRHVALTCRWTNASNT
jgi:hypothetical protein